MIIHNIIFKAKKKLLKSHKHILKVFSSTTISTILRNVIRSTRPLPLSYQEKWYIGFKFKRIIQQYHSFILDSYPILEFRLFILHFLLPLSKVKIFKIFHYLRS
jgi:hypothetical protein